MQNDHTLLGSVAKGHCGGLLVRFCLSSIGCNEVNRTVGGYANVPSSYGRQSPTPGVQVVHVPPSELSEVDSQRGPSRPPTVFEPSRGTQPSRTPSRRTTAAGSRPPSSPRPGDTTHVSDTSHPAPFYPPVADTPSRGRSISPPPRHGTATPFPFPLAEDSQAQLAALNQATDRLQLAAAAAEEAEDRRETEFRHHEEHRDALFLEREEHRNEEARQRAAGIWGDLEQRLAALPPTAGEPPLGDEGRQSDTDSIRIAQQAASQHAADVMETVRLEREDFARERAALEEERAQLMAEIRAEKDRVIEEKDRRINALEEELTQLRGEFEAERQQRVTEEAETRERERQELVERDEFVRAQLGDITNLVQDQRDMCETKKALQDARWEEKTNRRSDKEAQMIELRDMVQKIHDDMEADRARGDDDRRESREGLTISAMEG